MHRLSALWIVIALLVPRASLADLSLKVSSDTQPLNGHPVSVALELKDSAAQPVAQTPVVIRPNGRWTDAHGADLTEIRLTSDDDGIVNLADVHIQSGDGSFSLEAGASGRVSGKIRRIAPFLVLLPPLVAIALALWLRQVLLALLAGVLGGAWLMTGNPGAAYLMALSDFVVGALTDSFQGAILIFTATLGGLVGVMAKTGGTHGVVESAQRLIKGPRSAQLMTGLLGLAIFFDDYANTLLVGNTMRPVTDRFRVSREKLSYLVDSTAAPVTTVAVFSTWVGYQVGLIGDGLSAIGNDTSPYALFFASIPYASYSWFAMALVFIVVVTRRDLGPMLRAEQRARHHGEVVRPGGRPLVDDVGQDLAPPEGKPRRAALAVIPMLVVLLGTAAGLYFDGRRALLNSIGPDGLRADGGLREIISSADPAAALLWAVVLGSAVAIGMAVFSRTLPLTTAMDAWMSGAKAMLPALCILLLAWAIGDVCEKLGTANVVVGWATGNLSAALIPTVTFLLAAFLGFSTGTSWGTMAILMPIVIPLASELPVSAGLSAATAQTILLSSVACVLSGSVLGDHCSPISDTTIMSSMASGSDHVDHVRTQLPYALLAGVAAVGLGTIPAGFGASAWTMGLLWLLGVAGLVVVIRTFGTPADTE